MHRAAGAWGIAVKDYFINSSVIETSSAGRDASGDEDETEARVFQGHVRVGRTGTGMIHVTENPWDSAEYRLRSLFVAAPLLALLQHIVYV